MNAVRSKPNTFVGLLASMKINQNDGLFREIWKHVELYFQKKKMPEWVSVLHQSVESALPTSLQAIQGAAGDGSRSSGAPAGRPQLLEGPEGTPPRNRGGNGTSPKITLMSSASSISFTASSCASPDENDFDDKELNDLDQTVVEHLGKELDKPHDGKPGWEHVMKYLELSITMGEKKRVRRSKDPGEEFLYLLGDKQIKVGQLKEALLMTNLRQAKHILYGEEDTDTRLYASLSEGHNINQLGIENGNRQNQNIGRYTSLDYNIQNAYDQSPKPPTGIKRIISAQSEFASGGTGNSAENEDNSHRRESVESNDTVFASTLSPSDTSASSVFPTGPNVSPMISAATSSIGVLNPREKTSNTQDTSLNTNEGASMKETQPIPAIGDPEKKEAVLNADLEHNNLQFDRDGQAEVFGNTSTSFRYIDLQNHGATENEEDYGNQNPTREEDNQGQNDSITSLRAPDLGLGNIPDPSAQTGAISIETQLSTQAVGEGNAETIDTESSDQSVTTNHQDTIETLTTDLDNMVDLNAESIEDSSVND